MYVADAPTLAELARRLPPERVLAALTAEVPADDRYLHWDKLRHLRPPEGLSSQEWWLRIKLARRDQRRELPLTDAGGSAFAYALPDEILRRLHAIDQRCGGEVAMDAVVTGSEQAKRTYLVNSVMEEAIRSSQLEGAATSRKVAKDMLRSGRPPKNRSERMIRNNYAALLFARDRMGDTLTPEDVFALHRILTEGTLDSPDAAGRLQRPDEDRVVVVDRHDGEILHRPPPAEQLRERLDALCAFANASDADGTFVHPVLRAILLHFWLAYDHPFEDGNGRTARALFYWYMRVRSYWMVEYLSISRILREAPGKYSRSFLLTEHDERDATYFMIAQLDVIVQALDQFHSYLARKVAEVQQVERLLRETRGLNHRQIAVLGDAARDDAREYTMRGHANSHDVTLETARADLNDLADRGFLLRHQQGRRYVYRAAPALVRQLETA